MASGDLAKWSSWNQSGRELFGREQRGVPGMDENFTRDDFGACRRRRRLRRAGTKREDGEEPPPDFPSIGHELFISPTDGPRKRSLGLRIAARGAGAVECFGCHRCIPCPRTSLRVTPSKAGALRRE